MRRFSIALAAMLAVPMTAWGADVGFNNLRGPSTCLRSIVYRAKCPAAWDDRCPDVWIASLNLCRDYRSPDRLVYRKAMAIWRNAWFFDDDERKHRFTCGEGERIARLQEAEKAAGAGSDNPNAHDNAGTK